MSVPYIQPFCLEEEEPPALPPSTPPQSDQSESTHPGAQSQGETEPSRNLIQLETTEESNSKTQEVRGHKHISVSLLIVIKLYETNMGPGLLRVCV